jgi:phosphatidylinositol alpha-1,6-mannosyltransferase
MRCLLVASIFSPINGGSAVVYETLCRFAPAESMVVLAPWRHYVDGKEIEGWREFDAAAPYRIYRTELLRPLIEPPPKSAMHSLWRMLSIDLPLKLRVFLQVRQIVKEHKIDVVCIGELTSGSWVGIACQRLLGCKMVSYIHGEEITTETEYRFFGKQRRRYLHRADGVVAVSHFTERALMRMMSVPEQKITLIHNGVNTERFFPAEPNPTVVSRHGLQGKRIILTVGRIVPRKGMDVLIRALPEIRKSVPDAHLLFAGVGDYRGTLEKIVSSLGLESHVTFAGRVAEEDLADYYRLCDIFAMPNREMPDGDTEGFGLVFLEANACGKAVIAGRAGGAVEAVRDGVNGLLADGWSVTDVGDAVTRLLVDRELRNKIERAGLQVALASSSKRKAEEFAALCNRLVTQ